MPKDSLTTRSQRVLRLLQGVSNRHIAMLMAPAGFTQADVDEGWKLLQAASGNRYTRVAPETSPKVVADVDAWENYWYPLIDATLRRRFPEIHQQVFLNLSQESGPPVLISVRVLVDRVVALEKAADRQSKEARALLKERGLTKAALDEVRGLLEQAATIGDFSDLPDLGEVAAEQERAETAMWEWYREWSQIARLSVKDGRLLQQLGLGTAGRPRKRGEADDVEPGPEPEPVL